MAALHLSRPSSLSYPSSSTMASSFSLIIFITFSFLSFSLLLFSLFKRPRKGKTEELEQDPQTQNSISALKLCLSKISDKTKNTHLLNSSQLPHSVILELLSSNSPKWGALFSPSRVCDDPIEFGFGSNSGGEDNEEERNGKKKKRKRKKRVKKKKENSSSNSEDLQLEIMEMENGGVERDGDKKELVCLYPFTSSCSVTQRKIKQQYDQLVKSHESKGLTLAQVGQFVNCLVDAKNELQHKSECVKRKFTITKALLLKADRSSFDRLRQQICKLELEQKRLEEDAFVYNWLQHQLKLSPAYKKMVEIGSCMELKAKSGELTENLDRDDDQDSISFEEFLAQEKKDAFWQKHGKLKTGGSHPT